MQVELLNQAIEPTGLFDFFKKQPSAAPQPAPVTQVDINFYLLDELRKRLERVGHRVERSSQYASLTVNSDIEIATALIESAEYHPSLLHLMIVTLHKEYFPEGIVENIVGIGQTPQEKVASVLDNYLTTTFPPIMDSFSDGHWPELDFKSSDPLILWHPRVGDLGHQGQWEEETANEVFLTLLKDKLKTQLPNKKLNWLKLYIARQADGQISGECLLNNEPWEEGYDELCRCASQWKPTDQFLGLKQFIMFRRCDAYD